jgi:aerobic-type carbon monoxide dehydrogenase small subunit (CoxS/CutS family)
MIIMNLMSEGLRDHKAGTLYLIQQMFIDHTAFQCGFCTPGIIMGAKPISRNAYKVEIARTFVKRTILIN